MASTALEQAIGRAFIDKGFMEKWHRDFETVSDELDVPSDEHEKAREYLLRMLDEVDRGEERSSREGSTNEPLVDDISERLQKLGPEVQEFGFNVFKESIDSSKHTFARISMMSYVIFGVGISLFVAAAVLGLVQGKEVFSIAFGTFGVATFVSFFIFSPMRNVQVALSNLLQAEIAFMNFWDQLHFWAPFGISQDINKKKEASSRLQQVTKEIMDMLEKNIEGNTKIEKDSKA
jgi:ABC-type multidrug transport system fused ATPase/permease subunit